MVHIEKLSMIPDNCLNNKSEWVGSKIPAIRVESPKGTLTQKLWDGEGSKPEHLRTLEDALTKRRKRLRYRDCDQTDKEEKEGRE